MSKYCDLAKNLRARAYRLATKDFNGDGAKMGVEAADAIEELEDILLRIAKPNKKIVYCSDGHEESVLLARAALEKFK